MTRDITPDARVRGFELPEAYSVPDIAYMVDIANVPRGAAETEAKFALSGLLSHVLLAACSSLQPSIEDSMGGRFTTALMNDIRISIPGKTTYRSLIEDLPSLDE